ncbi:MAG: hypothetical protein EXQ91_00260 [Alphaproteobacteria bacterium]|nr:hypothetical protein [Alphaproteobacteria bacterium]
MAEPPPIRRALFVDLHATYSGIKVEAVLGKMLRLHSWRTDALMTAPSRLFSATHGAFGPTRCHHLRDYTTDTMRIEAKVEAEHLMESIHDFASLLDLTKDGLHIGRYIASTVVRTLRVGTLDPNSTHRPFVRDALVQSLTALRAGRAALDALSPDCALFNEKGYTPAGELYDLCLERGIDAVHWAGSHDAGSLVFKRYTKQTHDNHTYALDPATWAWVKARPWSAAHDAEALAEIEGHYHSGAFFSRVELQKGKLLVGVDEVRRALALDPTKKTAVIFSHIFYDATFFYGRSLYADYEQWLVETVRAAIENPQINWIVKLHPVNVWRAKMDGMPMRLLEMEALERALGKLPAHIKLMLPDTPINTFALFPVIDYGITVRGTVGIELAACGIPVITAGTGRYEGLGFTIDPATRSAYQAILSGLHELPRLDARAVELARRYALAVFRERPFKLQSFRVTYNLPRVASPHLSSNTQLLLNSPQAFGTAPDLIAFARWMERRELVDFFGARDDASATSSRGAAA